MEDLKENVLQATIDVFKEKGIKFTMDDIAKKLSISKKTIYTVTQNKNSLIKEKQYMINTIKKIIAIQIIQNYCFMLIIAK